jgi:hypothetical protein
MQEEEGVWREGGRKSFFSEGEGRVDGGEGAS